MSVYYSDDKVTLYHGDCLEHPEWWTGADVLVTDPPYGLSDKMSGGPKWSTLWSDDGTDRARPMTWDATAPHWIVDMLPHFEQAIIWGGNYFALPPSRGWLVWDKIVRNFTSGHCELAWTSMDRPVRAYNYAHAQLASEGKVHPTQKPLGLMQWSIEFTRDGASVADPFAGSGSTLVAAKALGRKAIGVELEERYCEIAARRLSQEVFDFGSIA